MKSTITRPRLCIVLPCYNEEEVLPSTISELRIKLIQLISSKRVAPNSFALFIDDGSADETWNIISAASCADSPFKGIKLAHNKGHQNALLAGYEQAAQFCDICISMDADLQDDINVIDEMVDKYKQGADIVYGVRNDRSTDTAFKRGSANIFYKLMNSLGVDTIPDHADFRLLNKKALLALSQYKEANMFLRGVVADIGLNTAIVYYARKERKAGESKYPLRKMIAFAADGITSFSTKPLRVIGAVGAIVVFAAIVAIVYSLARWASGNTISGWTTTVCSIWFIGGVLLLCISVLGEYIGKIYSEVKCRPRYIVESNTALDTAGAKNVAGSPEIEIPDYLHDFHMQPQMHAQKQDLARSPVLPDASVYDPAHVNYDAEFVNSMPSNVANFDILNNVKWEVDKGHGASIIEQ